VRGLERIKVAGRERRGGGRRLRVVLTQRLLANVGIVLVFAAFGFLIFRGLGHR
jgi:hypothetical protein